MSSHPLLATQERLVEGEENSEQIETGEKRESLRWAWVVVFVLGSVDWIWAGRIKLAFVGWPQLVCLLSFLLVIGLFYGYVRRNLRLAEAGNYAALWVAFSVVGAVFTYLAATRARPLCDAELTAIDSAMGFHWLAWSRAIWAHRIIRLPLFIAYSTLLPQIVGSILYFAHTGQTNRNAELIWIAILSLILSAIISAFVPAVGPFVHFLGYQTDYFAVLMTLRAGGEHTFAFNRLNGIIVLPSFHTVLAITFMYVHRKPSRSFVPIVILNSLMLLAIPSEGHHYLTDMLAGAIVAAVSIAVITMACPAISRQVPTRSRQLKGSSA